MDWTDQQKPPRGYVDGPAKVRIVENGPVRVALQVEREAEGSKFVQTIRLTAGDAGNRVEFANSIDWKTSEAALKATFLLTAANPMATYNWDVGTIQRSNNIFTKYEVAYGWAGHAGDWRREQTDWQALRLNQPLIAFTTSTHPGTLGKNFSFVNLSNSRVRVLALKKAERSDEIIVRLVEMDGQPQKNVRLSFATPLVAAREVNGQEMPLQNASITNGALVTSFDAYQIRTFAVKLSAPRAATPVTRSVAIERLPFNRTVASKDGAKSAAGSIGFDSEGHALPAEMLPNVISYAGTNFKLSTAPDGAQLAVVAKGQAIQLPPGKFNRVYLLAASADRDQTVPFLICSETVELTIQDWSGFIGQWDDRTWNKKQEQLPPRPGAPANAPPRVRAMLEYTGIKPGFVK